MKSAPHAENEQARIDLLNELDILDTLEEQSYDDLTRLAALICKVPISLVSLVDKDRQWFKSHHGLDARETPREFAFCAHAILDKKTLVVKDSKKDKRFHDNPLVTGDPKVIFYVGVPLCVRDDKNVGTLCVIDNKPRDITEEQQQALEILARQVETQLELRLRIKEMKAIDQAKMEFIAMVSHELRTPLTSIFGTLSLLNSNALDDEKEIKRLLTISHSNADRLIKIVTDILDITKLEFGQFKLEKKQCQFKDTLGKALEGLESYLKKCNVYLKSSVDKKLGPFHYDECRIFQVLNNLISNAAKFAFEKSTIEVEAHVEEDHLLVSVENQGKGIPPGDEPKIFSKFASNRGSSKLPGTGLGLNISKQLVELHGGQIWFENEVGKRTTFYFKIPLVDQQSD